MMATIDIKNLVFDEFDIELPVFDYTEDGTEYRFEAKGFEFEQDDFLVRCDIVITRSNLDDPDVWIENIELWFDEKEPLAEDQKIELTEKLKKSLNIT